MTPAARSLPASADDLAALLSRVAQGDRTAFSKLYRSTSPKLYGVILRILRRSDLAEETLQEVYTQVWKRASLFDSGKASAMTWMSVIARNRALDEVRKRHIVPAGDGVDIPDVADPSASPAQHHEASETLERLLRCLDDLDTDRSAAIQLAYLDGLSRQQLAERFSQPIGTIKSWLHRGLKQLRDCLGS